MLLELHVKNLALIERVDVEFENGLNILTGETGAGKSIIIGSIGLALGLKTSKDVIRQGEDFAYVELVFSIEEGEQEKKLSCAGIDTSEGQLIISRKITPVKSVSRINDETVTAARLREITGLLLDIHGQHEHQSLLYRSKHLEILDAYVGREAVPVKERLHDEFLKYKNTASRLDECSTDAESRIREMDFLKFEIEEIESAAVREGEEESLTEEYKRLHNMQKIMGSMLAALEVIENGNMDLAVKELKEAAEYDDTLNQIRDQLYDADSILSDAGHEIREYTEQNIFDEEEQKRVGERLDFIHGIQVKYGNSKKEMDAALLNRKERLENLEHADELREKLSAELKSMEEKLMKDCETLSLLRKKAAVSLTKKIKQSLMDLNFPGVDFDIAFEKQEECGGNGYDRVEFLICTNPGEALKPLKDVASGGELSRIMLAIKSVLADTDDIPTLIFDEIDTGISGRTAQKVSEKLSYISGKHQVICITHLPQIAAMADSHFEIEKHAENGRTVTVIRKLNDQESITELARLLGGVEITQAVYKNAEEMKKLAQTSKK